MMMMTMKRVTMMTIMIDKIDERKRKIFLRIGATSYFDLNI